MKNYVYSFDEEALADPKMLGGKGAGLVEMTRLGLPVPPGFVLTTEVWRELREYSTVPKAMMAQYVLALEHLEAVTEKRFGKTLRVSIRSSGEISMPGMMDTILDYGDEGNIWKEAIIPVLGSWNSPRARHYRRIQKIDENLGTAVVIQEMVYGDKGENSGTGVMFTRNPSTGEKEFFGEFLPHAQGEALVSGAKTPETLEHVKALWPKVYESLIKIGQKLENHFLDMQDIEFTIECGRLYILQTRSGKRTPIAARRIALALEKEGLISKVELSKRLAVIPKVMAARLMKREKVLTSGLAASPGVVTGRVALSSDEALEMDGPVILVRPETSPDDIAGMEKSVGVLTWRGGITSHAAVVARGLGRCCVVKLLPGAWITLDGTTGEVFKGQLEIREEEVA